GGIGMAAVRNAAVTWSGSLAQGSGTVRAESSGTFVDLPVSWASRTEAPDGRTSPEELLAAAHASCFAMALSGQLARAGTPPDELHVSASVTFDKVGDGWQVTASALQVLGHVPGCTREAFEAAAANAKDGCPISKALTGNVQLSVDATLDEG
ncbi:MAG TPA: OsmC family peroxiredoxin, partial [Candidatus Limnocylindria bacterium]|nr:OsmC family peroxiredoxin [Candidatus Limnocylindria bacterium]